MALKGEAKKNYQRNYMRKRRVTLKLNGRFVRPIVRPQLDAEGNPIPSYD